MPCILSCPLTLVPESTLITLCDCGPVGGLVGVVLVYGLTWALGRVVLGAGLAPSVLRLVNAALAGTIDSWIGAALPLGVGVTGLG
jgi:hypothetical protein